MVRKIAVFRQANGLTAELGEDAKVAIFGFMEGQWKLVKEMNFFFDSATGIPGLHRQLGLLLDFLGECKILVAKVVTGISYYELDKAGISIWEYPGEPISYLDHIWSQEESDLVARLQEKPVETLAEIIAPTEKEAGYFTISLKDIQGKRGGINSKQVLAPILEKGEFRVLEVACAHVPPWLQQELLTGQFTSTTKQITSEEVLLIITNNNAAQ